METDEFRDPSDSSTDPSVQRILNLTDGVVAIALTLLVLDLKVPGNTFLNNSNSGSQLWSVLWSQHLIYLSYAISFYVIALFWTINHQILRRVTGHREGLSVLNFFFLFTISLMPFSSNILGRYPNNPLAITLFAINLLLAEIALSAIRRFAVAKGIFSDHPGSTRMREGSLGVIFMVLILGASIVVAWTATRWAIYVWILGALVPSMAKIWVAHHPQLEADS